MRSTVLAMAAVLLTASASAGETVGLEQALREAVASHPYARAARFDAEGARAAVGEARSRIFPRMFLTETFSWTDEPAGSLFISLNQESLELSQDAGAYNFPPSRRDFETRVMVEQPLYDPTVGYEVRRAEVGAEAAEAASRQSAEDAGFAVFRAYLEVQQALAAMEWVNASRAEAAEIVRLAEERHGAGAGLKGDVLRARVFLSEAKRRGISAANDLSLARRRLALAMGRSGGEVEIAAPLDPGILSPAGGGMLMRGDLEALELGAREAALAHQQSGAEWFPRISASASYAMHDEDLPFGSDAGSWAVRGALSWEIFDGLRRRHTSARTAAAALAAGERAREGRRRALLARDEAGRRGEEARARLEAARAMEDEARESHRLVRERFEAGLSPLTDLLGAQTAVDQIRFELIQAESRYLLALGDGHFQQGTFLRTLLSRKDVP